VFDEMEMDDNGIYDKNFLDIRDSRFVDFRKFLDSKLKDALSRGIGRKRKQADPTLPEDEAKNMEKANFGLKTQRPFSVLFSSIAASFLIFDDMMKTSFSRTKYRDLCRKNLLYNHSGKRTCATAFTKVGHYGKDGSQIGQIKDPMQISHVKCPSVWIPPRQLSAVKKCVFLSSVNAVVKIMVLTKY
jgi:hypothetical protein